MLGNIVRFDDDSKSTNTSVPRAAAPVSEGARQLQGTPNAVEPKSVSASDAPHDLAWMQSMIDQKTRLFEAAQWEKAEAITELKQIAQTLCEEAWDTKSRAGEDPEAWPPKLIADLIVQSLGVALRNARLSQDPALPQKHQQALDELAKTRADNHRLRQRARAAEDAIRELKAAAMKEAVKQPKAAEKQSEPVRDGKRLEVQNVTEDTVKRNSIETRGDDGNKAQAAIASPAAVEAGSGNSRVDDVIRVIAQTGLCRWKDISTRLAELWEVRSSTGTIDSAIKRGIEIGLLRTEEVRLEWGGKPTGKVLILTEEGKRCAASLGVAPAESHYTRGVAIHKDGSHFYAILEVAAILATQYARVDFFPPAVMVEGGKYYPDVIAATAEGGRIFVEVERGTHKDERDREAKWLRAAAANKGTVYVVTPNQEVMIAIVAEICEIRDRQAGQIDRVMAFNVRAYRERRGQNLESLWSPEG